MENKIERLTVEAVDLLREMIAIPSPSFEEDAVCDHISKWLSEHNVTHRRVGNNIIAEHIIDPARPTLMLCAHIDTVSPSPEYSFDPYKPENCPEDMVQGLGSNDDGASVVSMIAAYRYLHGSSICYRGVKNRATPLAAGGGTQACLGGVVFNMAVFRF
jgi:acetylornithine deacetylase